MPARAFGSALSAALVLALSAPAQAQAAELDAHVVTAIGKAQEAASREDCAAVLRALDPVVPALEPGEPRILVQRMRLLCLGAEGRAQELPPVQQELAKVMPRDGVVKAIGVLIAADENRFIEAADQIATIAETSPRALDVLTGAAVRAIAAKLAEDHADEARSRMLIALARADWEPADIPELRIGFAEGAIDALIDKGEAAEAEGLLERIDQPEQLSSMVIDRHYAKLWPAIEARLGPASGTSVDRFARDKLAAFGDSPDSEAALRDASNAMLLLGRYQDVVDMTDNVRVTDNISREAVRTILYRARALAALGRNDEVEKLLAGFMTIDLRRAPAASTALISYAEFLDEIGRPAQALAVTRDARAKAGDLLTDLGKRWLDRTEICTLSTLGRTAEANSAIQAIKQRAAENQSAAIEALLCAKRDAEAARIAVKAFEDEDATGDLLRQFQPAGSHWAPAPSRLRDLWTAFLTRPEIKAAFDRKGRLLPRAHWPDPGPRAIPRRPANGTTLT
jgi:tetratricopeptide (TPR) repeat protein